MPIREIFRRFWPYARPFRRWLLVLGVFVVIGPLIDTALIWLFKIVVDRVMVPRDFGPFWWIALAFVGLNLLAGIVGFADDYISNWTGERFLLSLRTDLFAHLHRLSLEFFDRSKLGDVLTRLTGDIGTIETFVLSGVADALTYTLNIVFFGVALFVLRWDLALASLFVAPLFWTAARHFSRLIKQASRERRRRSGSITAIAEESLSNAQLVQAYNRQQTEVERFHEQGLGNFRATMVATRLRALYSPLVDLVELAGGMVVIGMGTWELSRGRISIGGLLAFLTYMTRLYSPIRGLGRLTNTIHSASASAERIIELMDERPSVKDRPGARRLREPRGEVAFEAVTFTYPGTPPPAIEAMSFSVSPGETVALSGPSGSGKSTIAKLLLRFYDPDSGHVSFDGIDLRDLRLESLRDNIAVVLQETLVFDGSVRDNIAYGRPGASEQDIIAAAKAADAHEFILRLPDGYNTVIGQRGRRLSGGQRQRLAIARAMIRDAPVLLLDEPTTGLDDASAQRILEPLRRLMSGRATIVISHSRLCIDEADRVIELRHGRQLESDRREEVVA